MAKILKAGETGVIIQPSALEMILVTIEKASLTIKADDKERKQGDRNPDFTFSYSGFKYNDDQNVLSTLPTASCVAQPNSPEAEYPIVVLRNVSALNYDINYLDGTLKVVASENLPTAFTPNGDTVNDVFLYGYKIQIFNRLGVLIFSGDNGWDGKHKGRLVQPCVYFYISTSPLGLVQKGTVEVIKTN